MPEELFNHFQTCCCLIVLSVRPLRTSQSEIPTASLVCPPTMYIALSSAFIRLIIQLMVVNSQQLIVVDEKNMINDMERDDEKALFAKRLNELCDDKSLPTRGRQTILKDHFIKNNIKMSQESTRKWLKGETILIHENKIVLCQYFKANYEWLATGNGEKYGVQDSEDDFFNMLGVDRSDIDLDLMEIFRIAAKTEKEKRGELKRKIKEYLDSREKKIGEG